MCVLVVKRLYTMRFKSISVLYLKDQLNAYKIIQADQIRVEYTLTTLFDRFNHVIQNNFIFKYVRHMMQSAKILK